ncbi:hypothetical protein [Marinifilum sp.]|uniref:hypothetical protein n=1 Tax=Marinifilum sp. TaxID=2033137 RepID=UPI003BA8D4F3
MIGFKLKLNGKETSALIQQGVLSIIITKVKNEIEESINLNFNGMDTKDLKYIDWDQCNLKEGDELILTIKKIEEVSAPIRIRDIDHQFDNKQKLKNYYSLKESLEKEGLI